MRFSLQWIGVVLIVTAVDLLVRFGGFADSTQLLWVEALLFPVTGLAQLVAVGAWLGLRFPDRFLGRDGGGGAANSR